jgi:hypothetical protein
MSEENDLPESRVANLILRLLHFTDLDEAYYEDEEVKVGDHEAVKPFFAAALNARYQWYLLAFIITLGLSILTVPVLSNPFFQVWGLLLDLVGAFILGAGLLRSEAGIERDSIRTTRSAPGQWGDPTRKRVYSREYRDPLSVSSEARDTADALVGISFLILGFAFQLIAALF